MRNKKTFAKKIMAFVLAFVLVLEMMPGSMLTIFAAPTTPTTPTNQVEELTVTVKDEQGNPVTEATVDMLVKVLDSSNAEPKDLKQTIVTDQDGKVKFTSNKFKLVGGKLSVEVKKTGYKTNTTDIEDKEILNNGQNFDVTLAKDVIDVKITPNNFAYDGAEHEAVTVSGKQGDDKVFYKFSDQTEWTEQVPMIKERKNYSVDVKVTRAGFDDLIVENIVVEVTKGTIEATITPLNGTYNGEFQNAVEVVKSNENDEVTYYTAANSNGQTEVPKYKDVINTEVKVKIHRTDDYVDLVETVPVTIKPATIDGVTITPYNGPYDAKEHEAATITGLLEGDTVTYLLDNVTYDTMPKIKEIKETYNLIVTVTREGGNYTIKDTVHPSITKGEHSLKFTNTQLPNKISVKNNEPVQKIDYSIEGVPEGLTPSYKILDCTTLGEVPANIAQINDQGELTIKDGGYVIKVIATVPEDEHYNETKIEKQLVISKSGALELVQTEEKAFVGQFDPVCDREATKLAEDNGVITYSAEWNVKGNNDRNNMHGIKMEGSSVKVTDYAALITFLEAHPDAKLIVKASKSAGTKQIIEENSNQKSESIVYEKAELSYPVCFSFGEVPEVSLIYKDPEENILTGPNGTYDNTWYNTSVTVMPDSKDYAVAEIITQNLDQCFSDKVIFDACKNQESDSRTIYYRNTTSGIISKKTGLGIIKIDTKAPEVQKINISISKGNTPKILGKVMEFFGKETPLTVTFSAEDKDSGIHHFNWEYNREEGASSSNAEKDSGIVEVTKTEKGKSYATIKLPKTEAEQLRGKLTVTATDCAGHTSDQKTDGERVVVVDTVSPTCTVNYGLKDKGHYVEFNKKDYYDSTVSVNLLITEANFYPDPKNLDLTVTKNNQDITPKVTWTDGKKEDQHICSFDLNEEGEYVVTLSYKDYSDNTSEEYTSKPIVIDKTTPEVNIEYSNENKETLGKDGQQIVTFTINDEAFNPANIKLDATAKDIRGEAIDLTTDVNKWTGILEKADSWKHEGSKHTLQITEKMQDGIYDMSISYQNLFGTITVEDSVKGFIVDHTAPTEVGVTYENVWFNDTIGHIHFYNPLKEKKIKVTLKAKDYASGVDSFTWDYIRAEGADLSNVDRYEEQTIKAVQDKKDKEVFKAEIIIPKSKKDQLRGHIGVQAKDKYSNQSPKITDNGNTIVVDSVSPEITAEYNTPKSEETDSLYYNSDIEATFKIKEANFYGEDVQVELKHGADFEKIDVKWQDIPGEKGWHLGTYKIAVPADHSGDGEYVFKINYTDKSDNKMKTYTSKTFVADTIAPKITTSYSNNNLIDTLQNENGEWVNYYKEQQTATVTIEEVNFDNTKVYKKIIARDINNKELVDKKYYTISDWVDRGDSHMVTITYPGDANYEFSMSCTDKVGNWSETAESDYFTVDTTNPELTALRFSPGVYETSLSGIFHKFYRSNANVTVIATDNISGIHSFKYSCLKAQGVSDVNSELLDQVIDESQMDFTSDRSTATIKFSVPEGYLGANNQFNSTVRYEATDRSNNSCGQYDDHNRIVVDNISPTARIELNSPVQRVDGIAYYNGAIHASLVINEANFYSEDVKVTVIKDGNTQSVSPTWSNDSTDIHRGSFTLQGDGLYEISISYSDKSRNGMASYASGSLKIDTKITDPVITINGGEGNHRAYKDTVIPAVSFEDENFESYKISLTRTRFGVKNEDVTSEFIGTRTVVNENGGSGIYDTFVKTPAVDGIYTMTVNMTDKSGHSATAVTTFTVNRYGSIYVYNDYLNSLIEDGGAYVQKINNDLIITEYNADQILEDSLNIEISKDGKPVEDVVFSTSPINNTVTVGESGWFEYQYVIGKENFRTDGVYKISVSSADATGNLPETSNFEDQDILFRVDSTAPEINSIVGLEDEIINAQDVKITYNVFDTIGLASVKVFVNDKQVEEVNDFESDHNNYEGSFILSEKDNVQNIKLVVEDKAGNITDTSKNNFKEKCVYEFNDEVMVSTNPTVRAKAWAQVHVGAIAGTTGVLAAGLFFLIVLLRKKKDKVAEEK